MSDEEIIKNVNTPKHYNNNKAGIETIMVTRYLTGSLSNAWKYLSRYLQKGTPKQDIRKTCWYINDYGDNILRVYTCKNDFVPELLRRMQLFIDAEEVPEVKAGMEFIANLVKLDADMDYDETLSAKNVIENLQAYSNTLA